jgi:hypothetical protein
MERPSYKTGWGQQTMSMFTGNTVPGTVFWDRVLASALVVPETSGTEHGRRRDLPETQRPSTLFVIVIVIVVVIVDGCSTQRISGLAD